MTDEERQRLLDDLRYPHIAWHPAICGKAADEIERLAAENERLKKDAECWRRRND